MFSLSMIKRKDTGEYGVIVGYERTNQLKELIAVCFIANDNESIYEKIYTIRNGMLDKEIEFIETNDEKYKLIVCSRFN